MYNYIHILGEQPIEIYLKNHYDNLTFKKINKYP